LFTGGSTVNPASPAPGEPTSQPPSEASAAPGPTSAFSVAVIVDTTTQHVSREQAQASVEEAGRFLREFSPFGLAMLDFVEDPSGGSMADMAARYAAARSAPLPNGIVIFSNGDNGQAKTAGGYGFSLALQGGFRNAFASPAGGSGQLYVAVVDHAFRYMACGYGGADNPSSTTSLPGECRGQTGVACVLHNGYSMCSNAAGNLYTSTPTYAVSSMIVHALLHNFAPGGDQDHYATPECNARMGYPAAFFDLQESEYYNGLCPFVYEEFNKSYQP
jgi:hypothetical protein